MLTGTSGLEHRILAIDPGPDQSGVVLFGPDGVEAGVHMNAEARGIVRTAAYDTLAVEQIRSYGLSVGASVFDTCLEVGRFYQIASDRSLPIDLIPRLTVKLELCGSPRAKDPNIRQALIDLFGGPGVERKGGALAGVKSHAWAALAVAVTCARTHGWMPR